MTRGEGAPRCLLAARIVLLGLLFAVVSGAAAAEEECAACRDDIRFPEAAGFLEGRGYPAESYTLLLTWEEAVPNAPGGFVAGYRLRPADGSEPFDIYADTRGGLLSEAELREWGIPPKNWAIRPQSTLAESGAGPGLAKSAVAVAPVPSVAPDATIALPPVDMMSIFEEDASGASSPAKGVERIGVFQHVPGPLRIEHGAASVGAWREAPGGARVWSVQIASPDAKGQRVHFSRLRIPQGAQLLLYNAKDPAEVYGPFGAAPEEQSDFWAPTCFSETVAIECRVPDASAMGAVSLVADRVVHIYKGFESLRWAKAAGSCNLDVTCYPDWSAAARGVCGLGTIGSAGYLWCTGALLVDTDPQTQAPYLLTAYHCVSSQTKASQLEAYWLYQTSVCDGTPPAPASVPRTTGGADFLSGAGGNVASNAGTDFALLRLRNQPPAGVTYLGWSTIHQPVGAPATVIHHPRGDYKRITFGAVTDSTVYASNFYEATYAEGTTEAGSSGSPLMRDDTQQVIGQLWGGDASCSQPYAPDYYGRFDLTFPVIQSYLAPAAPAPEVDFLVSVVEVEEADTQVEVTVVCNRAPGAEPARVGYRVAGGTAREGVDFALDAGEVVFEGTQQTQVFAVAILDDVRSEPDETIVVELYEPTGCALAGGYAPLVITILDNDPDSDGDGLSDYEETTGVYGYFTDPFLADTDGDGMSDYDEIMGTSGLFTDPTRPTVLSALAVPWFGPQASAPLP